MAKFNYYNNGIKCIKVNVGDVPPSGFVKGRLNQKPAWNKGLTKETDSRVALNGNLAGATRRERHYLAWNKGLTKENDERVLKNHLAYLNGMQEKYGVTNPSQLPHSAWNKGLTKESDLRVKKISDSNLGKCVWNKGKKVGNTWTPEAHYKRYMTQLINGTLGKNKETKVEQKYYEYLLTLYEEDDIIKQYYDKERYPFKCDFYIKSQDLFIEVHGMWTHGGRPYNENDESCLAQLHEWEEKAKTSQYYKVAIYTWTDLDVRKLNTFIQNNLNFKIVYV